MQIISDFQTSVRKALEEIDPKYEKYEGLVVCGSHAPNQVEEKLAVIRKAREQKIPTLGICMGLQLMAIEYARNVLGIQDATSEEIGDGTLIVKKLGELRVGMKQVGETMESHWHNYYVQRGFGELMGEVLYADEILERVKLSNHPFFVGVQFHPEYQSAKHKPHPLLVEFLNACRGSVK